MIFFYDFEFNLLLAERNVVSWQITKNYNKIGTFSAHLPLTSKAVSLLLENDYIVVKAGGECAIVTGIEVRDELIVYGRTCNWLLSKRIVLPFDDMSLSSGEFVKNVFEDAFSECPQVLFGAMDEGSVKSFKSETPKPLSDTIFDALAPDKLGNELVFDTEKKSWVFNILSGTQRNLIVSEANKNASGCELMKDISMMANTCYYKDGDSYIEAGSGDTGLYRFEAYINTKDEQEAIAELSKYSRESTANLDAVGLSYKKDYCLGDTVRVQLIKGDYKVTKRLRIVGVEISSGSAGYREKPIFGEV